MSRAPRRYTAMDSSEDLPVLLFVALNDSSLRSTIFVSLKIVLLIVALHQFSLPSTIFVSLRSFPLTSTLSFCITRSQLHPSSLSLSLCSLSISVVTSLLSEKLFQNLVLALKRVAVIYTRERDTANFENLDVK